MVASGIARVKSKIYSADQSFYGDVAATKRTAGQERAWAKLTVKLPFGNHDHFLTQGNLVPARRLYGNVAAPASLAQLPQQDNSCTPAKFVLFLDP